jgi:hypothetical protein
MHSFQQQRILNDSKDCDTESEDLQPSTNTIGYLKAFEYIISRVSSDSPNRN